MQTNPLAVNRSLIQTTNPTLSARRPAANTKPESIAARARGADVVILSRQAVAQSRPPQAQNAQSVTPDKNAVSPSPITPAANAATASRGAAATFGQETLDLVRDHFGARKGDENFNAEADADGNGVINFKDITHILANWGLTRS